MDIIDFREKLYLSYKDLVLKEKASTTTGDEWIKNAPHMSRKAFASFVMDRVHDYVTNGGRYRVPDIGHVIISYAKGFSSEVFVYEKATVQRMVQNLAMLVTQTEDYIQALVQDNNTPHIYQLLDKGINVNSTMYQNTPLLSLAIQKGVHSAVEDLLSRDADVNLRDGENKTPLYYVIHTPERQRSFNQKWFAKRLIEQGANLTNLDGKGLSALALAVKTGQTKLVDVLLDNGADINMSYLHYKSDEAIDFFAPLLHYLVRTDDVKMFLYLVQKGASLERKNSRNQTALDLAQQLKKDDFIKQIEQGLAQMKKKALYRKKADQER